MSPIMFASLAAVGLGVATVVSSGFQVMTELISSTLFVPHQLCSLAKKWFKWPSHIPNQFFFISAQQVPHIWPLLAICQRSYSGSAVLKNRSTENPQYSKSAVLKICSTQKQQFLKNDCCKKKYKKCRQLPKI